VTCMSVCVSVCLSVRERISETTRPIFTRILVLIAYCLQCFDAVDWAAGRASGL